METSALRLTRWTTFVALTILAAALLYNGQRLQGVWGDVAGAQNDQARLEAQLDAMVRANPLRGVVRALAEGESAQAGQRLKKLEADVANLSRRLGTDVPADLEGSFRDLRAAVQRGAGLAHAPEVVETLLEKVTGLRVVAENQRWRNLAAHSTRLENRVRGLRAQRAPSPQVRYAQSDVTVMERLARTLDAAQSQMVLSRLGGIRQELEMLLESQNAARAGGALEASVQQAFQRWLARARLAAGAVKTRAEARMGAVVRQLWVTAAGALVALALLGFLWHLARRQLRHAHDQAALDLLRGGVLNGEEGWRRHVGEARIEEVARTLRVARKRMALGDDLQRGLPVGVVLVNGEGRLTWSNPVFCDQFHLDADVLVEEDLRWDAFARRLLLPEGGAVERALGEAVPGTWQVRAEIEDGVWLPFEMHVSPLEGSGDRKVLVLFYPLALNRETIDAQARLFMAPLRELMAALEEGRPLPTGGALWRQSGLEADWERFSRIIAGLDGDRRELLSQLEASEAELQDGHRRISELEEGLRSRREAQQALKAELREFKEGLVSIDQMENELGRDHALLVEEARQMVRRAEQGREAARAVEARLEGAKDAVAALERTKQDCKKARTEVVEEKTGLINAQNRFLGALPAFAPNAEALAVAMKDHLGAMDTALSRLDTRLTQLDVQVMKVAMTFQGPVESSELAPRTWDLAGHEQRAREALQSLREDQDMVVARLRRMVEVLAGEQKEVDRLLSAPAPSPDPISPFDFL